MSWLKAGGLFLGIATIPVIGLARTAAGQTWSAPLSLINASLMVAIVASILFLLALALGKRWVERRTLLTSIVGWFAVITLNTGALRGQLEPAGWTRPWQWLIAVLAAVGLAGWIGTRFDPAARYLSTFIPILVVFQMATLISDLTNLNEPAPLVVAPVDTSVGAPPSIWVIVLDSHASPKVLRDQHNIDLSEAVARLETVGFRVWDDARANYSHTLVSIPSLLSGEVWDAKEVDALFATMLAGLHADTPLIASIQRTGLEVRMLPTNWSRSGCGALVDDCIGRPRYDDHWYFLLRSTPLQGLLPGVFVHPWPARGFGTLDAITSVESSDRHFTFVHSLASHPPTVIAEDCGVTSDARGRLRDQLRCTHDALLEAVGSIDLTTDIVIVTADHGYLLEDASAPSETWSDDLARNRFSAFTAISTPDGCEDRFPTDLSGAQILPLVLNCYGGDLAVPAHRFMKVDQRHLGGISATELAWDGWSVYAP